MAILDAGPVRTSRQTESECTPGAVGRQLHGPWTAPNEGTVAVQTTGNVYAHLDDEVLQQATQLIAEQLAGVISSDKVQ